MANQKISELSGTATSPSDADLLLIENASAHKQITFANLIANFVKSTVAAVFSSTVAATGFIEGGTNLSAKYKSAFSENTGFNKNLGTSGGTVAEGNHNHSGVYEPYDTAIVKSDEAETITASWNFSNELYVESELNFGKSVNANWGGSINWTGYDGGDTQYRDLGIYDGKNGLIAFFDGANKTQTNQGTITATNFIDASDEQLKKDVNPLFKDYLDEFENIKAVQYRLKKGDDSLQFGVIAQDIEKIYPNIVEDGKDGLKGVNYRSLSMITLAKVQEQQKEIDTLTDRLDALEEKIK